MKILPLVFLVAMSVSSLAAAENATAEKDKEKVREELREARREMEQAAQRVAELSRQMGYEQRFVLDDARRELLRARLGDRENRLMLGVTVGSGSEQMGGLEVFSVTPGGPADKNGIQAGDIITAIDGVALDVEDGAGALSEALEKVEKGKPVKLAFRRGTDERSVEVVPEEMDRRFHFIAPLAPVAGLPGLPRAPMPPRFLDLLRGWGNIELVSISEQLGEYFGTDKGLLVVSTPRDDELKLQDGDVILTIGGREPDSPSHAMRILGSYQAGEKVTLEIMRNRKQQSVEIEIPERRVSIEMTPRIEREIVTEIIAPN